MSQHNIQNKKELTTDNTLNIMRKILAQARQANKNTYFDTIQHLIEYQNKMVHQTNSIFQ